MLGTVQGLSGGPSRSTATTNSVVPASRPARTYGDGFTGCFIGVVLGFVRSLRKPDSGQMSSTDLVNAGSPPRQREGGLRYFASTLRRCPSGRLRRAISLRSVPAWTKKSGDRSNEQGRGGAHAPPCPQASAASRKRAHPPKPNGLEQLAFGMFARYKAFARVAREQCFDPSSICCSTGHRRGRHHRFSVGRHSVLARGDHPCRIVSGLRRCR